MILKNFPPNIEFLCQRLFYTINSTNIYLNISSWFLVEEKVCKIAWRQFHVTASPLQQEYRIIGSIVIYLSIYLYIISTSPKHNINNTKVWSLYWCPQESPVQSPLLMVGTLSMCHVILEFNQMFLIITVFWAFSVARRWIWAIKINNWKKALFFFPP